MKKVFEFLFDNWIVVLGLALVAAYYIWFGCVLSSADAKAWFSTPINKITLGDILIIVLLHAFINRTEIKK